jgi:hypothetical protein
MPKLRTALNAMRSHEIREEPVTTNFHIEAFWPWGTILCAAEEARRDVFHSC